MTYSFSDSKAKWHLVNTRTDDLHSALPRLLEAAKVTEVNLVTVTRSPSLRGGDISDAAKALTALARAEHRNRGFGFWDFLLAEAVRADEATRTALIQRAVQHNSAGVVSTLTVSDFVGQLRQGAFQLLPTRTVVSLSSQVGVARGRSLHLPMLDFALRAEDQTDETAVEVAGALGLTGDLYRSGTSYHLIGDCPVDVATLWSLLGRAQLLSPIIDHRWAAHQFIDGFCALRISTDTERHTQPHRLVASTRSIDAA